MEVLAKELEHICRIIERSKILRIVTKKTFIRIDGKPMLYVKAKSPNYYIYVEGMEFGKKLHY